MSLRRKATEQLPKGNRLKEFEHLTLKDRSSASITLHTTFFIVTAPNASTTKALKKKIMWKNSIKKNDPAAGSPTATLLRLFLPPILNIHDGSPQLPIIHIEYQSEETTGGVYIPQGRILSAILERIYKGFLFQV